MLLDTFKKNPLSIREMRLITSTFNSLTRAIYNSINDGKFKRLCWLQALILPGHAPAVDGDNSLNVDPSHSVSLFLDIKTPTSVDIYHGHLYEHDGRKSLQLLKHVDDQLTM